MRTGLVVVILSLIALAFFNPGMDDFRRFVASQSERILQHELGDGSLGQALSGAGAHLAGRYVDRITERNNYGIFSTYTIDFDGSEADAEEWRFLGIAGRFVQLERPASLREREAGGS